jgi:hypothetical protein
MCVPPGNVVTSGKHGTSAGCLRPVICSSSHRRAAATVRPGEAAASSFIAKCCEGCGRSTNGHCRHCDFSRGRHRTTVFLCAAARMVTADIATLGIAALLSVVVIEPQHEWSLPTLRLSFLTLAESCGPRTPQHEWSLPTLRLHFYQAISEAAARMVTADIATLRSEPGQILLVSAAARMVTADIATSVLTTPKDSTTVMPQHEWSLPTLRLRRDLLDLSRNDYSRSTNGHCRHCDAVRVRSQSDLEGRRSTNGHCRHCDSMSPDPSICGSFNAAARIVTADIATSAHLGGTGSPARTAAARMVTADIATDGELDERLGDRKAAARMVTADIATQRPLHPSRTARCMPQRMVTARHCDFVPQAFDTRTQ